MFAGVIALMAFAARTRAPAAPADRHSSPPRDLGVDRALPFLILDVVSGPNPPPSCPRRGRGTGFFFRGGIASAFLRAWGTIAPITRCFLVDGPSGPSRLLSRGRRGTTIAMWTSRSCSSPGLGQAEPPFFGVPKITTDFIPSPLFHVPSHFRIRGSKLGSFRGRSRFSTLAVGCWLNLLSHHRQRRLRASLRESPRLPFSNHCLMILPFARRKSSGAG